MIKQILAEKKQQKEKDNFFISLFLMGAMTLSIMTFSRVGFIEALSIKDTLLNVLLCIVILTVFMLSFVILTVFILSIVMLIAFLLSFVILTVFILSIVLLIAFFCSALLC